MNSQELINTYVASGIGGLISPRPTGSQMEILQITAGEASVQIGTEFITMRSGDIVYVPIEMMLRAEAVDGFASLRGVSFAAEIFDDALENFDIEVLSMFYVRSRNSTAVFRADEPIARELSRYMETATDEFMAKELCYRLVIKSSVFLMVASILRSYSDSRNDRNVGMPPRLQIALYSDLQQYRHQPARDRNTCLQVLYRSPPHKADSGCNIRKYP